MDLRISVPMTFMRSPGLRQFFYRKRKLIFFGQFFFKFAVHYLSNGPEDFGSDDIYEVPSLRQFFYRKRKLIFFGPSSFQIRGPLSQERTWGFRFWWHLWGPRPQTIFVYIYIKIFLGPFFFQIRGHYLRIEPEDFGSMTFLRSPDITLGQSQCAIWKSMQKVKRFFFLGIYIFLWVGPNFESPDRFKLR